MEQMDIKEYIIEVLKDELNCPFPVDEIDENTSLLTDIALDSLQIIQLVVAIESRLNIPIFDDEISPDLFDKLGNLCAFIQNKISGNLKTEIE